MLKFIGRLIFALISNLAALWVAAYFIKGFKISSNIRAFLLVVGIFTLINVFVKPIIKFILSPVIILTFGLGLIILNAVILYAIDIYSGGITINGLTSLFYATLIISLVNFILHFADRK